jgi:hypothetical protein
MREREVRQRILWKVEKLKEFEAKLKELKIKEKESEE